MNLQEAFDAGFDAVKAYVDCTMNEFGRRLAQLEAREPLRNGRDGIDGKSVTAEDIRPMVEDVAAKIVSEAKAMVRNYVDSRPLPKDGKDGEPGIDGKDGVSGRDGRDGIQGLSGKDGVNGKDGRDGIDGKDGAAGLDGKDGLGFDDMTAEMEDDGRVLCLRWVRGEQRKEVRITTGLTIYRGVFQEGHTYERGDLATWGGSVWHCNAETGEKPGDGSKTWTLAVKKGRDGKDGKDGDKGERGLAGKDGRNAY